MSYKFGLFVILLCSFSARLAVGVPPPQDESSKPGDNDTKHADENNAKKPGPDSTIPLHIKVSAEGKQTLPTGSTIELKGNDDTCRQLERTQELQSGDVTFPGLPVCKVQLRIFITGFDAKQLSVDLATYKDPMRILVKLNGPPVVNYGPIPAH